MLRSHLVTGDAKARVTNSFYSRLSFSYMIKFVLRLLSFPVACRPNMKFDKSFLIHPNAFGKHHCHRLYSFIKIFNKQKVLDEESCLKISASAGKKRCMHL